MARTGSWVSTSTRTLTCFQRLGREALGVERVEVAGEAFFDRQDLPYSISIRRSSPGGIGKTLAWMAPSPMYSSRAGSRRLRTISS